MSEPMKGGLGGIREALMGTRSVEMADRHVEAVREQKRQLTYEWVKLARMANGLAAVVTLTAVFLAFPVIVWAWKTVFR